MVVAQPDPRQRQDARGSPRRSVNGTPASASGFGELLQLWLS
jgi:hypothetical protein